MLSSVVTILLFGITLLIIASLIISAWRDHRRMRVQTTKAYLPAHPLDRHVTVVLHMQDGIVVSTEKPTPPPVSPVSSSWYTRRRTLVSVGLLLMVLLTLIVQGGFAGDALQNLTQTISLLHLPQVIGVNTAAHFTASQLIARGDSAARD